MPARGARLALVTAATMALFGLGGCGSDPEIHTVADFDGHPCALIDGEIMKGVISPPYMDLAGVEVTLNGTTSSTSGGDTYACTYAFAAQRSPAVREVGTMTVTIGHSKTGSQPYAICMAGVTAKAGGYRAEKIGDQACVSPSSDLWMNVGDQYFHVVIVPQPGFASPVEANQALGPLIIEVARAAAARMPRS